MSLRPYPSQVQLTREQVSEIFLENPQISVKNSIEFMKKLTVIAISNISHMRQFFPESAFSKRKLNGMKVKLLKGVDEIPGTTTLINWIKSAFDAVQLQYLKNIMLVVQKPNSTKVHEMYIFKFIYKHEAITCHLQSESEGHNVVTNHSMELPVDIKKSAQQLLRSLIILTTTMDPLPDDCGVSMSLEFYDNVPDDYEVPQYFNAVDSLGISFVRATDKVKLGKIDTKFSTFGITTQALKPLECIDNGEDNSEIVRQLFQEQPECSTSFKGSLVNKDQLGLVATTQDIEITKFPKPMPSVNLEEATTIYECGNNSGDVIKCGSDNTLQHKLQYNDNGEDNREIVRQFSQEQEPECSTTFKGPLVNKDQLGLVATKQDDEITNLSEPMSSVNLTEVKCICECDNVSGEFIKCSSCLTFQHKACYKLLDDQNIYRHICVNCHDPNSPSQTCTAPDLVNDSNMKIGALYRRALALCLSIPRVSVKILVNKLQLNQKIAQLIFKQLDSEDCFRPSAGNGSLRSINTEHLKDKVLNSYFNASSNTSNVTYMETKEMDLMDNIPKANVQNRKRRQSQDNKGPSDEMLSNVQQKRPRRFANTTLQTCK